MGILDLGRYKGIVFAITGFLVFIAIILAVNHVKVGGGAQNLVGLNFLAQQQARPPAIFDSSTDILARLRAGQPIDTSIETMRKDAAAYDQALLALGESTVADSSGASMVLPAL